MTLMIAPFTIQNVGKELRLCYSSKMGLISSTFLFLVLIGCSSPIPFEDYIQKEYTDKNLYNFQYYLSKVVVLVRAEEPKELEVEEGIGKQTVKRLIEEVHIKKNTPGKLLDIRNGFAVVSFDPQDNSGIPFKLSEVETAVIETEAEKPESRLEYFKKRESDVARRILGDVDRLFGDIVKLDKDEQDKSYENSDVKDAANDSQFQQLKQRIYVIFPQDGQTIIYKGKVYTLTKESFNAYLLIDVNPEELNKRDVKVLPGREWDK